MSTTTKPRAPAPRPRTPAKAPAANTDVGLATKAAPPGEEKAPPADQGTSMAAPPILGMPATLNELAAKLEAVRENPPADPPAQYPPVGLEGLISNPPFATVTAKADPQVFSLADAQALPDVSASQVVYRKVHNTSPGAILEFRDKDGRRMVVVVTHGNTLAKMATNPEA